MIEKRMFFIISSIITFLCFSYLYSFDEQTEKETNILNENYFLNLENIDEVVEKETIIISDETNWCLETNDYAVPCWVHPSWIRIPSAKWIWRSYLVGSQTEECTIIKKFNISGEIKKATLYVASDNECDIWINDTYVGNTSPLEYTQATIIDVKNVLKTGDNTIKLWGRNRYWFPGAGPYINPAGIIYKLVIIYVPIEKDVIIDAGHGKYKYLGAVYYKGAVGPNYGDKEDDLNLDMAFKIEKMFKNDNIYKIYNIRTSEWDILPDCPIGIEKPPPPDEPHKHNNQCINVRVNIANKKFSELRDNFITQGVTPLQKAEQEARKRIIFVSIHCNSSRRHEVCGTGFLYSPDYEHPDRELKSFKLGDYILNQLLMMTELVKWQVVKTDKVAVISKTKMPAVLIETAFLSNTISDVITDEQFLHFEEYRDRIPRAIYEGIKEYFNSMGEIK